MSDAQGVQGSTRPSDDGTIDVGDIHDRSSPCETGTTFLGMLAESVTSRNSSGKISGIPGRPDNSPIQPLLWTATRTSDDRANPASHPLSVPKNPFLDEPLNIGPNEVHRSTTTPTSSTNENPADPTRSDVHRETDDPEDSTNNAGEDKDLGSMGDDDDSLEVNGGDVGIGDDDGDDALDVVGGEPERIAERPAPSEREERGFIDVGALGDGREGGAVVSLRAATGMLHNGGENSHGGGSGCRVSCLGDFKFTADEVHRMSKRYPTLNAMGSETAVPLLSWLAEELGMNLNEMRNLIMRHPRLMAYRVKSHLEPKTKWLRERLHLGQDQLRKLVITYPAVLSRSVESNLEPKLKWLEGRLGATEDEVSLLIRRFPVLFGYSTTKNLEPTISFFMGEMRAATKEVKTTVMSCPAILSRSLDKRIIPRAQQMQAREIVPTFELHKWVVTTYTDAQFSKWLNGMRGEVDVRRKQAAKVDKQVAEERRPKHPLATDEGRTEDDGAPPARSPPDKRLRRGAASTEDPGSWWRRGVRPSPS